jgi:polar amino acid transport system substrate-binding protein
MMTFSHPIRVARTVLLAIAVIGPFDVSARADGEAKLLAPSGSLRVGIYPGSRPRWSPTPAASRTA